MPVCDCARSFLAGCQQSVSWARGLLYELVESLGYVLPNYVCHEHVDDLSHQMASKSKVFLQHKAIKVGNMVHAGVRALDLRLSEKSAITANSSAGKQVAKALDEIGVKISLVEAATDLGIETAGGIRRCAKSQNKRIVTAKVRASRVGHLARINSKARCLGLTGVHPNRFTATPRKELRPRKSLPCGGTSRPPPTWGRRTLVSRPPSPGSTGRAGTPPFRCGSIRSANG